MAINRTSPKKGKVVDIPDATITIGTPTAGAAQVSVAFTSTSANTGGPVQKYTAISNPGGFTGSATASPVTVTGLTNGTAYTFTVAAANATGNGVFSSASASATPIDPTSYESIATYAVGSGGVSSVSFTSIPDTYKHLQVRAIVRTTYTSGTTHNLNMTINNDTGANYSFHQLQGNGSAMNSYGENVNRTNCVQVLHMTTDASTSGMFGTAIIDILDYANTNKKRTVRSYKGQDQNNSDGTVGLHSYLYNSTTAISRLDFIPAVGNLTQYSHIALYGIKGA